MKAKKNPKFDLESKRKTFFLIGLVISLAVVLLAFKGANEVKEFEILNAGPVIEPDPIIIPITRELEEKVVALPEFKLNDKIEIVADNTPDIPFDIEFEEPGDPLPNPIKITEESHEEAPLIFAQQMPEFPGGPKSLNHWLSKHVKYPTTAQNLNISGRVYLSFVVDKDGSITNIKITRGVDPLLDEEAIRVVSAMPKWNPGLQNGLPVKVCYNLYIKFTLN